MRSLQNGEARPAGRFSLIHVPGNEDDFAVLAQQRPLLDRNREMNCIERAETVIQYKAVREGKNDLGSKAREHDGATLAAIRIDTSEQPGHVSNAYRSGGRANGTGELDARKLTGDDWIVAFKQKCSQIRVVLFIDEVSANDRARVGVEQRQRRARSSASARLAAAPTPRVPAIARSRVGTRCGEGGTTCSF